MKCNELIKDNAWVLDDFLTPEECEDFIQRAKQLNIQDTVSTGDKRHRNSNSAIFNDEEMATKLFERIKDYLPQEVVVTNDCDILGLQYHKEELIGRWKPCGLGIRWHVLYYPGMGQGHFGPHRDAHYKEDEHHRSLMTLGGYLTDRPTGFGGATRFIKEDPESQQYMENLELNEEGIFTVPECHVWHRVEADSAGKASMFFHDLLHDGEPLKEGSPPKWLFLTKVMFERDPTSAPTMTQDQRDARLFLEQAEHAETVGDIIEATRLYRKAYRLDPSLDGFIISNG